MLQQLFDRLRELLLLDAQIEHAGIQNGYVGSKSKKIFSFIMFTDFRVTIFVFRDPNYVLKST